MSTQTSSCRIIHATDLHYLANELTDHGELFERVVANGDGKVMDYIDEIIDTLIDTVIAEAPDALIISGDASFNGERRSHEVLAEKLSAVRQAGIPVYILPGNHDLYYALAASYSGDSYTLLGGITAGEFASIYADCGFDGALSRDEASLSYTAALPNGLRLLMLDTNTADAPGSVKEDTLLWVRQQLEEAQAEGHPVLAVSHQTLLTHNSMFRNGFVINNSSDLLDLYETYGVIANLCGHMHLQHYAFSEQASLPDIVTSAVSITPNQYGLLTLTWDAASWDPSSLEADYQTVPLDVAGWAEVQGLTDPNLLQFADYSRSFFYDISYRKTCNQLTEEEPDLTETQLQSLADFSARVNLGYFTGTMDTVDWDQSMLDAWSKLSSGVMYSYYFKSIAPEREKNYNRLAF